MLNIRAFERIKLHAFGPATVRRLYTLDSKTEIAVDVRADSGEIMHLSTAYVSRLIAEQAGKGVV